MTRLLIIDLPWHLSFPWSSSFFILLLHSFERMLSASARGCGPCGQFLHYLSRHLTSMKRETGLRWCDLKRGDPVEVLWEGTWYQTSNVCTCDCDWVKVRYDGFGERDSYEVIEKDEEKNVWSPLPVLHLYGLCPIEIIQGPPKKGTY